MKRSAKVCLNSDWGKQGLSKGKQGVSKTLCSLQAVLLSRGSGHKDQGQSFQRQLLDLLAPLEAHWLQLFLESCEKRGDPGTPVLVLGDLAKATRLLWSLWPIYCQVKLQGKKQEFWLAQVLTKFLLLSLLGFQLGHLHTVSPFVLRHTCRGQRMKMSHVNCKISGWVELTKTGGECRHPRSHTWKTRLKDSCSSQMLLGNRIVEYCQFLGSA